MDNLQDQLLDWRHALHAMPELGFEEFQTSNYVAAQLRAMGLEVHRHIAGTGLVATLSAGTGTTVIALRADMDALGIHEQAQEPYRSRHDGRMHACGHDGHMAMLLGAARLLSTDQAFSGTVCFVFQPAEEHGRGARAMIADGLLERFAIAEFYGVHNWPGLAAGSISTRVGGIMASEDNFAIHIKGQGTHAARPHMGKDPLVVAAEIILALQTVVSRNLDPAEPAVISCTELHTDGIRNAIPSNVVIKGDTRSYSSRVQRLLAQRMREISEGMCRLNGVDCDFSYTHEFSPTINARACVDVAVEAARRVVGADRVNPDVAPVMASEDFGAFLERVPGCFAFIGNGTESDGKGYVPLHNAHYDINDDILQVGARYLAEIARTRLRP